MSLEECIMPTTAMYIDKWTWLEKVKIAKLSIKNNINGRIVDNNEAPFVLQFK